MVDKSILTEYCFLKLYDMPEGPEAMINAAYIKHRFSGYYLVSIESNTKTKRDIPKSSVIIDAYSYGKFIIIVTKDYYVHIHLGISGWLVDGPDSPASSGVRQQPPASSGVRQQPPRIYKYGLAFSKNQVINKLFLKDRRRFSSISILTKEDHLQKISELGCDILSEDFTVVYAESIIMKRKRNICTLLLDQKVFAGLGNYIKNEALYMARISPYRKGNELSRKDIGKLVDAIKHIAVSNALTWYGKYKISVPKILESLCVDIKVKVPYAFLVYDREKDSMGNRVTYVKSLGGRRTFYVPKLQK